VTLDKAPLSWFLPFRISVPKREIDARASGVRFKRIYQFRRSFPLSEVEIVRLRASYRILEAFCAMPEKWQNGAFKYHHLSTTHNRQVTVI
jgi:hypothetical protein